MKKSNEPRTLTEAQINANRENAKKSTGPRTAEGKAASSRNRLLQGLRASKHILLDEDPEEFLFLLDDHLDRFQPVGASEENLVLRIAADQCRLGPCLLHGGRHLPRPLPRRGRQGRAPPRPVRHQKRLRRTGRQTGAASTHPARRARPPGPRFQRRLRGSQLLHQTRPLRNPHRALHRPLPPPVENVSGSPHRLHPQVGQAVPPAETATPAATPPESTNYHSNPKNGGIAQFSAAAMALMVYALLDAVPQLIAALTLLLTGPRTAHNRPKMNILHLSIREGSHA